MSSKHLILASHYRISANHMIFTNKSTHLSIYLYLSRYLNLADDLTSMLFILAYNIYYEIISYFLGYPFFFVAVYNFRRSLEK